MSGQSQSDLAGRVLQLENDFGNIQRVRQLEADLADLRIQLAQARAAGDEVRRLLVLSERKRVQEQAAVENLRILRALRVPRRWYRAHLERRARKTT